MDPSCAAALGAQASDAAGEFALGSTPPHTAVLDFFFPGFSVVSGVVQKYLHLDLNLYIPAILLCGGLIICWRYLSEYTWGLVEGYLMSVVDIRTDDEIYNMLMSWVASQRFAQGARRFVVNTNLNSRSWFLWRWTDDEDDSDDGTGKKKKALAYTPTFGSHWFWYQGRLLIFRRHQNREQTYGSISQREEISISCFGRNPWVLKELLHEARQDFMKRDEAKTLIYRGTSGGYTSDPSWQRCMARTSRPFSTVILNEDVKKELIEDVTEYLDPATRRWYANRGIPYRRGYLLYGPPGTGKSSLSLALAGFFKMRIYIVSLSSGTSNEENLSTLFAELPRRCVVLLEDIDTAGLTHTRDNGGSDGGNNNNSNTGTHASNMVPGQKTPGNGNGNNNANGRLSLSGLLNILDGVASQEGRVLIMTTNHLEKLDKALIRPGRVDMIVKFDRADKGMTAAIFRAIYAPLEGDDAPTQPQDEKLALRSQRPEEEDREKTAQEAARKEEIVARVNELAEQFAAVMPEREFSPAEIQGYLMKNKRSPEMAVQGAEQWITNTRKEKQEKEAKDAEETAKREKEDAEQRRKEQKKEEKKKRKAKTSRRKGKKRSTRGQDSDSSESSNDSSSLSSEQSESEEERPQKKSQARKRKPAEQKVPIIVETQASETKADEAKSDELASPAEAEQLVVETQPSRDEETLTVDDGKHASDSGYGTPGTPQSAEFDKV